MPALKKTAQVPSGVLRRQPLRSIGETKRLPNRAADCASRGWLRVGWRAESPNRLTGEQTALDLSMATGSIVILSMITVSELARLCGLSRSTVLYYESIGLLKPAFRGETKYRFYGEKEIRTLRQIRLYRSVGLSVDRIRTILASGESRIAKVLQHRLRELDREIEMLRGHQEVILRLLQNKSIMRSTIRMTKEKWVSVMKAAGFSEEDMRRWHAQFEHTAPDDHQEFLQFLHIPPAEIQKIREWSRKQQ